VYKRVFTDAIIFGRSSCRVFLKLRPHQATLSLKLKKWYRLVLVLICIVCTSYRLGVQSRDDAHVNWKMLYRLTSGSAPLDSNYEGIHLMLVEH